MLLNIKHRLTAVPHVAWLLLLLVACLTPFADKALHIDDPLFLRVADQIRRHPNDFYGCSMNWYGSTRPMLQNFDNPPLACYYLALVAAVAGRSEVALHLGYLLPALAAAWGIFTLAKRYCAQPFLAAAVAVFTPVFLISATTLMCDVMLLAFWVWAIAWFERGLDTADARAFLFAGCLAALAFGTKFTGLALVPLLAVYGGFRQRRIGTWIIALLVPLLFVAGYEWLTHRLYGRGLLLEAMGVSSRAAAGHGHHLIEKQILGLSYLGGCLLPVLLYLPWLWSGRQILLGLCCMMPCLLLFPYFGSFALLWNADGKPNWLLCLQSVLFISGGLHILVLALSDFWRHRDEPSLLLLLWILGIFVFASSLNWTLNGRSVLPLIPAVGILVARRLDLPAANRLRPSLRALLWPAFGTVAISIMPTWADSHLADAGRSAASRVCATYQRSGKTLWFEGHWGFQYYMEQRGARALERGLAQPTPGDLIVIPSEGVNTFDIPTNRVRFVDCLEFFPNHYGSTMSGSAGAGFYAATGGGPFPFSIGDIDPERYYVFEVTQTNNPAAVTSANLLVNGALGEQFELDRGIKACTTVLRANPADVEARFQLGLCLAARLKLEAAGEAFSEVLRRNPDHGPAHLQLAGLLKRQQKKREAIAHYRAACRCLPDSAGARNDLAWIVATDPDAEFRNGQEAVQLALRAKELAPEPSGEFMTTLAAAYAEAGLFEQAVDAAQQAIDLAKKAGNQQIVALNEGALPLYRANRPFRQ